MSEVPKVEAAVAPKDEEKKKEEEKKERREKGGDEDPIEVNAKDVENEHLVLKLDFRADELFERFPPKPKHKNKRLIFGMTCPKDSRHSGVITYSKWKRFSLPETIEQEFPKDLNCTLRLCPFDYKDDPAQSQTIWHVNFADKDLFGYYFGALFAQDELQVSEHPLLASTMIAVKDITDETPHTIDHGQPTPILIKGVERRCAIDTNGIYGRAFASASEDELKKKIQLINPPTISNIIAIAAPRDGEGKYTFYQLKIAVETAYSGFKAAVLESPPGNQIVIHSGSWGTGAFGGSKVCMALLQLVAAHIAGVKLIFHAVDEENAEAFRNACNALIASISGLKKPIKSESLLSAIQEQGFKWGESDGN